MKSVLGLYGGDVLGVHGVEHLAPGNDPFILAANHSTRLEALVLPSLFAFQRGGRLISFIADWNFALVPGLATILRCGETILLVRKPARPAFLNVFKPWFQRHGTAFERAARAIQGGRSIGIFPEGTTNRDPARLLRGFDGAARLSLETGRPVIPVGVRFPEQPPGEPIRERSRMEIFIGGPRVPPHAPGGPSRQQVRDWHGEIMREIAQLSCKTWNPSDTRRKRHGIE